jgi:hypothetical protein
MDTKILSANTAGNKPTIEAIVKNTKNEIMVLFTIFGKWRNYKIFGRNFKF